MHPETPEEERSRKHAELQGKNVAQYSVLLTAWIQTKMEHDKTLVAASLGGIGFLLSVLSFAGVSAWWEIIFFAGAFVGFITTVLSALTIYKRNAKHLENEIRGNEKAALKLEQLDKIIEWAFWSALICAIVIGSNLAWSKYMAHSNTPFKTSDTTQLNESLIGVERLSPKQDEVKSLAGIENLRPQAQQISPSAAAPATPPTPASQGSQSGSGKANSK
jgi:hypothetical protein